MDTELISMSTFLLFILIWLFLLFILFVSLAIYFIPVIIAYARRHNNLLAITILTILTGWTFFGWLAGLLWSLNSDTKDKDLDD